MEIIDHVIMHCRKPSWMKDIADPIVFFEFGVYTNANPFSIGKAVTSIFYDKSVNFAAYTTKWREGDSKW